jgi:general stress protein YciG
MKGGEDMTGHTHKLTGDERSRGGSNIGGNFRDDPDRASEAGKIGGRH